LKINQKYLKGRFGCFFIATGPVEKNGIFWWTIPKMLPDNDQRQLNIDLWAAKESERKAVCEQLVKKICVHQLHRQCMTIEDVQLLAKIPHVTIGCHTVHHGLHVNCTDAEIESEIKKSQKTLEEWIDQKVFSFAYPAGSYKGNEGKILKKYDIKAGFTIDSRPISPDDDPYFLPRYVCMDNGFLSENICHMLGIWTPFISKLKRYSFLSQISKWQKTLP
jgi:peptidoglycan/xylan/chitin deacetylase (PgdA/CDA1 family)